MLNLKSSPRKHYSRHHDMVNRYGISVSQMTTDMFRLSESKSSLFSFITGFVTQGTGRVPLVEQEILIRPEHMGSSRYQWGSCCSFAFCVMICISLFVFSHFLSFPLWSFVLSVLFRCTVCDYPLGISKHSNRIDGVMVSVFASSAVDRGFEPRSGQIKDYKICICCFSAKHASLGSKSKDWLARIQNNVSERSDISMRGLWFQ